MMSSNTETTPLLRRQQPSNLSSVARYVRRVTSRTRTLREPSVLVRELATEQIEERQSDWAYSKPVVILDLVWNLAFVIVSVSALVMSWEEKTEVPLRVWIVGYCVQCVVHMVCVFVEFRKRLLLGRNNYANVESGDSGIDDTTSFAKHLESANTIFSFVWWIVGFYWVSVSAGGQILTSESSLVYWLCVTFLALDAGFIVVCVAVACIIGIGVCCCLPCIIALLYAFTDQEGATKEDIERLPRYKFQKLGNFEKQSGEIQESFGGIMVECSADSPSEHVLPLEDAECCICLCAYEDGDELRELPCRHHFHCACVDKWLHINAICPLCKFNILKNESQTGSEEV